MVDAVGRGTLVIETKKGKRYIREVIILVPRLDENLLSRGQMIEYMYFLLFGDSMLEICDDVTVQLGGFNTDEEKH